MATNKGEAVFAHQLSALPNPIEVVEGSSPEEVLCPSTSSSFRLEQDVTTAAVPPKVRAETPASSYDAGRRDGIVRHGLQGTRPELDPPLAIRSPGPGNLASGGERDRFLREARSVARSGIRPSFDHEVGQIDELPYLVNEVHRRADLDRLLTARRLTPSKPPLIATLAGAAACTRGMALFIRTSALERIAL